MGGRHNQHNHVAVSQHMGSSLRYLGKARKGETLSSLRLCFVYGFFRIETLGSIKVEGLVTRSMST